MKQVFVLGAKGMLGQILVKEFCDYNVVKLGKNNFNITDSEQIEKLFNSRKPDIIINTAAYTNVDGSESHKDLAIQVNGNAVGMLAGVANKIGALFIHISTDYVFGQENKNGYEENVVPENPLNIYGKSKLLGEKLLLKEAKNGLKYYLIRTSWLFGRNGNNFVQTMIKLAQEKKELKIVNNQYGKATYANDLAMRIKQLVEKKKKYGIYHITNEPVLTWYQFAKIIFAIKKKLNSDFSIPKIIPVNSKEFPRPAKRPKNSVLLNTKLPKGRKIEEALIEYFQEKK